jgi:hypothetical protein
MVSDAREALPQLDDGRQFTFLMESSADRGGIGFGHHEHGRSMDDMPFGRQAQSWMKLPPSCPLPRLLIAKSKQTV